MKKKMISDIWDTLKDDQAKLRRVCGIVTGFLNGTVSLIRNPNDGYISCQIGETWFYFADTKDENLSPDEMRGRYDLFYLADMVLKALDGLDEVEYEYCNAVLTEGCRGSW